MKCYLNGEEKAISSSMTLGELLKKENISFDTALIGGFSMPLETKLSEHDDILAFDSQKMVDKALYERLWSARYGKKNFEKLQKTRVAICGAGGLGSHISISLARLGIGELLLIDKDVVDLTNLGRQCYDISDVGKPKVVQLKKIIERITPLTRVKTLHDTLDSSNYATYLEDYPYIMEAFDSAENKASLTEFILSHYPNKVLIGASGMSGHGDPNLISSKKVFGNYYLSGDGKSDMGLGLLAPRVMLCAAHQASTLMTLLLSDKENEHD